MSNRTICIPTDNAFPDPSGDYDGLTKREYFAAMAMQGGVAADNFKTDARDLALMSVEAADALIAALNDGGGE